MPGERARQVGLRYGPFLALAAVQVILITVTPSVGRAPAETGALTSPVVDGGTQASGGGANGASSEIAPGGRVASGARRSGIGGPGVSSRGSAVAAAAARGIRGLEPNEPGPWPWSHPWTIQGDRGRCAPGGLIQENILAFSPPCVPKVADHGLGATYQGVTKDKVVVVDYRAASNAAGDAILGQQDLAANFEEQNAAVEAFQDFFNKHYEFYGRKLDIILYQGQCDGTDPTCVRNDARFLVKKFKPFYVTWPASVFFEFHDELSRLRVANSGGWHFHPSFNRDRRPYVWDLFADGVTHANHVAAYWCGRMVGKQATLAGDPSMRSSPRKLGIVTQGFDVYRKAADDLVKMVSGKTCAGPKPPVFTYNYDIARGQEQMTAIAAGMRSANVTTVVCMCEPVMPIFLWNAMDQQSYFPEHLLAGTTAITHDFFGRLYSQTQWQNAFGPSLRPMEVSKTQSDHTKAWNDVRPSGEARYVTLNDIMFLRLAAMQIMWAGPNLTPFTLERGTLEAPQLGGYSHPDPWPGWRCCRPTVELMRFGPGDYTGHEDAKHVRWSTTARSNIDGNSGAYVCIDPKCDRRTFDQWGKGAPRQ